MAIPESLKVPKPVMLPVTDEELDYLRDNSTISSKEMLLVRGGQPRCLTRRSGAALFKGWVVQCPLQPQFSIISVHEWTCFMQRAGSVRATLEVCLSLNG